VDERKGNADEQEQAQRGADHRGAEASGSRSAGGGHGSGNGAYAPLKKLVADSSLDKDMLQSVIRKSSLGSYREERKRGA
jgi:hypothetical protein